MNYKIFNNKKSYDEFHKIFCNNQFSINKFWFKRSMFLQTINSNGKIQYKTALKLLNIYNSYYKLNLNLNDLFNMNLLMNKRQYREVQFEFKKYNTKEVIFSFIDEVLGWEKSI